MPEETPTYHTHQDSGDQQPDPPILREQLAAYAHDAWSGWMRYMLSGHCSYQNANGEILIPASRVARWRRQMETPYADLPPEEQESDRAEADKMLAIVNAERARQLR